MARRPRQHARRVRYPDQIFGTYRGLSLQSLRGRATLVRRPEFNSLCQWKFAGKIDRVRLPTHVLLPAIAPALATAPGLLFTAECTADFRATRSGVYIRDSAVASGCAHESFRFARVVCEDR